MVSQTVTSPALAVVTGAASRIGYELTKCCARRFELVTAADEPEIELPIALRAELQ